MHIENHTRSSEDGYEANMEIVFVEPGGFTDNHSNKARLLINFGEHGRELISPEIALRLLQTLCNVEMLENTMSIISNSDLEHMEKILYQTVLVIIPMENVNGRRLVESGQLCERKNGRGVDPNRNWSIDWGVKEPDYDPKEEHPGKHPFSEPETAIMRDIATNFRPHLWLNVHSGMEAMFVPYDHKNEIPEGENTAATLEVLKYLNQEICRGKCAVGPGGTTVGYLAHGTATDFMQDVLNISIVSTWEVYGDLKARYDDCFRMFNPLSRESFEDVTSRWTAGVLALIASLPNHPAVPELSNLRRDEVFPEQKTDANLVKNLEIGTQKPEKELEPIESYEPDPLDTSKLNDSQIGMDHIKDSSETRTDLYWDVIERDGTFKDTGYYDGNTVSYSDFGHRKFIGEMDPDKKSFDFMNLAFHNSTAPSWFLSVSIVILFMAIIIVSGTRCMALNTSRSRIRRR